MLVRRERLEDRVGQIIRQVIQDADLGAARSRDLRTSDATIVSGCGRDDEPFVLECPQHAAEVPGVQSESCSQLAHLRAVCADLPEQPIESE